MSQVSAKSVPSVFVDGVANIGFSGGVVRIDFAELSPTAGEGKETRLERKLRVITTLEGFLAAHQTMQRLVEQLAAQGKLAIAPARPQAEPSEE
jgi:hypothetical protein